MRWTNEQYREYLERRAATGVKIRPAEPQQDVAPALVEKKTGKIEDTPRIGVRIGIYRSRITDLDNAWGGSKALTDCLVLVGLLPGDSPSQIDLTVQQIKVGTREDEQTVIEITYPYEQNGKDSGVRMDGEKQARRNRDLLRASDQARASLRSLLLRFPFRNRQELQTV